MYKKIFINSRFLTQKITGSQRFAIEISKQLKKLRPDRFVFVAPKNIIQKEIAKELDAKIIGFNTGHIWEQIDLPLYLKKNSNPLLLNLVNTAPIFYNNKIITIHYISIHKFPKQYSLLMKLWYSLNYGLNVYRSVCILTVSEFSKKEIEDFYNIKNIYIINNSVEHIKPKICQKKENYVLSVSSLSINKNFVSVLKSIDLLNKKGINVKYKVVGGFNKNLFSNNKVEFKKNLSNVEYLGYVSDFELMEIYSKAVLFVYPSFYEGFGIPPLEAMACGCPCVVSNAASLPEVCGDAAYYVNPYDVEDIARGIEKVLTDENLRQDLIKKGFENIKRFSWEKSARKIIEILNQIG
jgi:glycosyltransferase involved in cell wall biosynthesis